MPNNPSMREKIEASQMELDEVMELAGLKKIEVPEDLLKPFITILPDINNQKKKIITMMVLGEYLQIDSKMSVLVTNFFFRHCQGTTWEAVQAIVTTHEFEVFQAKIVNEMPFLRKLSILKEIYDIPKDIVSKVNKLNDLRNAIAHSLVPENLEHNRTLYNEQSIFTNDGIKVFLTDVQSVMDFLQNHFIEAFEINARRSEAQE